ncbi:MAG: CsgG/HfaB family protein [Bacteroidetes bacterium]|nr:CsgG/HfaB family protein [Bacteroidota bacterium]MBU1114219.1 CsgG/HfaB family protein [Bacteroidota bacterium]MBU1797028.1 CsgG/HfaB family protein [Bacteroidota bacterium]
MKKHLFFLSLLLVLLLSNCSSIKTIDIVDSEINLTEDIDSTKIVILPFEIQGSSLPKYTSVLIADKLSNRLFLTKHFSIVEKLRVDEVLHDLDIDDPININYSEIKSIGSKLNANYIVVGKLLKYASSEFISPKSKQNINLTFRILSVKTGEIIGLANINCNYKNYNIVDVIDTIVNEIAEGLKKDD